MKVCVGLVRWGPRAAEPLPQEDFMTIVPADWTRDQCDALFGGYAGDGEGVQGGTVRIGCILPEAPGIVWEGEDGFAEDSCGW